MKLKYLNSLRGRYALVTLILSAFLLAGSFFAQNNLAKSRDTATVNISTRNNLLRYSRNIRTTIRKHYESLVLFLLMPDQQHSPEYLYQTLEQTTTYTKYLLHFPWVVENNKTIVIKQLRESLSDYDTAVHGLIKIRKNPDKQFPAMAIARNTMQTYNEQINNAMNIALIETLEDSNQVTSLTYKLFLQIRHDWTQMISLFRIYLANSIGNYDIASIPAQEKSLFTLHTSIQENIVNLQQHNLGFQSNDALITIEDMTHKWLDSLKNIITIHRSKNWRADVTAIRENIQPHITQVWNNLHSLDVAIETSGNADIQNLAEISEKQMIVLWTLTLSGLTFLFLGFYFLELLVLRPIANVSLALKHEATGDDDDKVINHSKITETQNLIDAFHEMRLQVHQRQKQLEHQALHDALTGLANRTLLFDRLQYTIRTSRRENKKIALLMIDLDRFKEVNDTLGHHIGDTLLIKIAERLVDTLRDADTVARLGGDEFAVLLSNTDEDKVNLIADKIHTVMSEIFHIEEIKLYIKVSIGIVLYPKHGDSAQALLQKSDVAMYVAKHNKLGQSIYDPEYDKHSIGRLALMSDLRTALKENQLELHYQPKIDMSNGNVIGFEALLRWYHGKYGSIPPTQIIPLAEQTGDIGSVTKWVVEKALDQLKQWQKQNITLSIAINLSMYNLYDTALINQITRLLEDNTTLCHYLIFEITESAMMEQPDETVEVISHFDRLGVRISIDDFGTGFSSLSHLKRLPVSELKIDKSFVMEIHNDDSDAVIVRSTIDLAHNLGLKVVAEGIENQDVYDIISILGCDHAQGYHIGHPLPVSDLEDWIKPDITHNAD